MEKLRLNLTDPKGRNFTLCEDDDGGSHLEFVPVSDDSKELANQIYGMLFGEYPPDKK